MIISTKQTIIPKILELQPNRKPIIPKKNNKIGFIFSTKDRVDLTLKSLKNLDNEKRIDIIAVECTKNIVISKNGTNHIRSFSFSLVMHL